MHNTLRCITHSLSCLICLSISPFLNLKNFSLTSLLSFFMHACRYEPSVFVVVVYKHVIHVRNH